MKSLSSTLDRSALPPARPGSSVGRSGWHQPSFQIIPLIFLGFFLLAAAILKKFLAAGRGAMLCEGNYGCAACAESASE